MTSLNLFSFNNKKILFFWCKHSWDYKDSQTNQIKRIFESFAPDLVLVETTRLVKSNSEKEAVLKDGESGLATYLAHKKNIKVIAADPDEKIIIKILSEKYSKEELILYFLLRMLNQYQKLKIKPSFNYFLRYLIKRYKILDRKLSYSMFKKIFKKLLKKKFDPQALGTLTELFNPGKNMAITNTIAKDDSFLRDSYVLCILKVMLEKFNRILVIRGSGHANFFKKNIKILK
ncbi:MAG: hypothetical protein QXL88_00410 [Candidatus Pacearchaeota archaeon]